jgi:murein DD-endopeptidase MepM/ murein hydrolase activator NlpD
MKPEESPSQRPKLPWQEQLAALGVLEFVARLGSHLAVFLVVAAAVWVLQRSRLPRLLAASTGASEATQAAEHTLPHVMLPTPGAAMPPYQAVSLKVMAVRRAVVLHTDVPSRPREKVIKYKVQRGDTIFGIAEKFGLKPETILWGNYDTLADDPHRLRPGQELNILPTDGTYYQWHAGDNLRVVAKFFGVKPEDIIDYPGNHLPADTDPEHPNIEPGTWLIVPGGRRQFVSWSAPQIPRSNPAVAKILGPGFCGEVYTGPVGSGTFIWPTTLHYLSGYDYSPAINHYGIDIAGKLGYPVYAVDNGVVVYAGWNNWGYGNVVVIDHGNGWQSLYAHLSRILVQCGQGVTQGEVIGAIGSTGNSTGPHLHFELRNDKYGKVNPWNFLPPP